MKSQGPMKQATPPCVAKPPAPKAEKPWYRTAGWWEGLSPQQTYDALCSISVDAESVPVVFDLNQLKGLVSLRIATDECTQLTNAAEQETGQDARNAVANCAWLICMELVRRDGYSTQHVDRAWQMAVAFERAEQEKRNSTAATTTNEGGGNNANAG